MVPEKLRLALIEEAHSGKFAGQEGIRRFYLVARYEGRHPQILQSMLGVLIS